MQRRAFLKAGLLTGAAWPLASRAAAAPDAVSIRFNWSWVGNYAPVVLGRERGYYRDAGINLTVGQGKGSGATIRQAGAKLDTFVWADTSALLVVASQGVPVKAVMMLTKCIALEGANEGIRAACVCPGFTRTPMLEQWADGQPDPAAARAGAAAMHPLGRLGSPTDIANAFVYLASDDAAWVTGTAIVVDGGLTTGLWVG